MSYKYCVVWFTNVKSWLEDKKHPRKRPPLVPNVKVFRSLKQAQKFRKEWTRERDTNLYVLYTKKSEAIEK